MKKRGFTLIELLAVIVILAIIALIATPAVLNIIDDAKRSAAERSTEAVAKAAEVKYMASYAIDKDTTEGQSWTARPVSELEVDNKPSEGTYTVVNDDNNVTVTLAGIKFDKFTCTYDGEKAECNNN